MEIKYTEGNDMKKILALVLALVMVLTAVSALAAGSPENPGGKTGGGSGATGYSADTTEETKETELATVADTDATKAIKEELKKAAESGDVLSTLPADVKAKIGEEFTKVSEMVTIKLAQGLDAKNGLIVKKAFQTPYKSGEKVTVLLAAPGADGKVEWIVLEGTANADGEVVFVVDEATYNKIAGTEIVMVPVSK